MGITNQTVASPMPGKDDKSPVIVAVHASDPEDTPKKAFTDFKASNPFFGLPPSQPTTPNECEGLRSATLSGLSSPTGLLGFSPTRHIQSSWRIRGQKLKPLEEDPLMKSEYFDDQRSDTLWVEEEVTISDAPRRRRARKWAICGMVCGITLLSVLLVINGLLFFSRKALDHEDDPDAIFADWGRVGSGTEERAWYPTDFLRDVQPISCHSHNDYWRKVPLFSALHAGCTGVEADVWLFPNRGTDLFVGHDTAALQPNRTFRSLYVDPIVKILEHQNPSHQFNNGSRRGVFDVNPSQTLTLLVDVKTGGADTWKEVVKQLEPLRTRGWLSEFKDGKVTYGPVTVVGTGNTPFDLVMANATQRDYFYDAPLDRLEGGKYDSTNSYYASVPFKNSIGNVWFGGLGDSQLRKIREQIKSAHDRGLKVRYWDIPAWPIHVRNSIWDSLVKEGVDMLNVDDLRAATRRDWTKHMWLF
ncbi:hypothetical protein MGG_02450 [Pyricularia oryzae 70-15]|uniref:Altered inheritance of mitochondria protein 6 n=1 Tax=Pyricularia oryzae (strain 70-15 / ATCC MYA-4617 / FGSC 8958) TaxID=242507 RepID=G4MRV9_PYRO7|nr:uncharacterized protein MGG_02450 [Pyricularia oryzae 70-15]EHA56628.1 hypothetical protein MGG_02450 [Pyricularia oryzae 70-15]